MITLPPTLKVDRNEETEKELLGRVRTWLDNHERADGIHASDLLTPRKGYWRALDPQPSSDREIGLYLVGKVLHAFVIGTGGAGEDGPDSGMVQLSVTDEGSVFEEELGLWYSPDKRVGDKVVEFKTSRGREAKTLGDIESYLQQLLIYLAAEKKKVGELWVLYLNARDASGKTSPAFRVYRVEIGDAEIEALRLEIRKLRDTLAQAKTQKDPAPLPLCPAWICHPEQCAWWSKCKPEGRYENPEYVNSKRK